jgi:acetyl-CoA carboxylase carboxyl transferase subunit beta
MPLFRKTKYSTLRTPGRRDIPAGLWQKCKGCDGVVYTSKLDENGQVCPLCGYHYPLTAEQRIELLTDEGSFVEQDAALKSGDPLHFEAAGVSYKDKYAQAVQKTGVSSAVRCGVAALDGQPYALGVMDFRFMGGSMGSVLGEKITRITETATAKGLPLVVVTASGGARMQEGMFSLVQMAKTSGALARHADAGLPYVVIMTHPTTAGVTASFASLGDVIVAEPKALIGFAGARVIKQTTQSELPEGFQSSEFLVKHGFIDRIIAREDLRHELSLLLDYLTTGKRKA